jgi:hypothetical protein
MLTLNSTVCSKCRISKYHALLQSLFVRRNAKLSRDNVDGEVIRPRFGRTNNRGSIPGRDKRVFSRASRPAQ